MSTLSDVSKPLQGGMTLKLVRIARLKELAASRNLVGPKALGDAIGKKSNQARDLIEGVASFGEKVARSIEHAAQLPVGWLDDIGGGPPSEPPLENVRALRTAGSRGAAELITELAALMKQTSEPTRKAVSELLKGVALSPGDGSHFGKMIEDLLIADRRTVKQADEPPESMSL